MGVVGVAMGWAVEVSVEVSLEEEATERGATAGGLAAAAVLVHRGEMEIGAAPAAMRLCLLQGMNVSSATHLSLEGEEGDMVGEMGEVRTIYITRHTHAFPHNFILSILHL